jgi:CRISPR-associated protein Cas2
MSVTHHIINGYDIMWLFVMFDLPTNSASERKVAARFRKDLKKDGFGMLQYSVYIRHCASGESALVHINRVRMMVPDEGLVSVVKITDKQFGDIVNMTGKKARPPPQTPLQLELF